MLFNYLRTCIDWFNRELNKLKRETTPFSLTQFAIAYISIRIFFYVCACACAQNDIAQKRTKRHRPLTNDNDKRQIKSLSRVWLEWHSKYVESVNLMLFNIHKSKSVQNCQRLFHSLTKQFTKHIRSRLWTGIETKSDGIMANKSKRCKDISFYRHITCVTTMQINDNCSIFYERRTRYWCILCDMYLLHKVRKEKKNKTEKSQGKSKNVKY